jgi:hypothetical protein
MIKPIKQAQQYAGHVFRVVRDAKFYDILKKIEQKKLTTPEDISDAAVQFSGAKRRLIDNIATRVVLLQDIVSDEAYLNGWDIDKFPRCSNMAHYCARDAKRILRYGFGYHVAIKAVKRA